MADRIEAATAADTDSALRERMLGLVLTNSRLHVNTPEEAAFAIAAAEPLVLWVKGGGAEEPALEAVVRTRIDWTAKADALLKKHYPSDMRPVRIRAMLEPLMGAVTGSQLRARAAKFDLKRPASDNPGIKAMRRARGLAA